VKPQKRLLLKRATDNRELLSFIRGIELVNGTMVSILGSAASETGVEYFNISPRVGVTGYVRAETVRE
jgi:hypothetical protein